MIRYISLFSGIECASLAAKPLGWEPICFSEIEPFPSAVLAHHYPDVPNVGDMTRHDWSRYRGKCDVVIGGSPCQAFSVAGRRESLADDRGNLTLSFVEAVNAIDPAFVIWENVPGVLFTADNAFGCFLAAMAGCASPVVPPRRRKWSNAGVVDGPRRSLAWRILDAQFFGVPQRRRRIFLIAGRAGERPHPAEILFEQDGLQGDLAKGKKTGETIAASAGIGADVGGEWGRGIAKCLTTKNERIDYETETFVVAGTLTGSQGYAGPDENDAARGMYIAHTLRGDGFDASEDGTGRGTSLAIAFHGSQDPDISGDVTHPVGRNQGRETCIAFTQNQCGDALVGDICGALGTNQNATGRNTAKVMASGVRRLTPRECERLQGLPDDYTLIPFRGKPAADGPRYKAIGNGMAVPCIGWVIGRVNWAWLRVRGNTA